jgi:hypothetical protein
MTYVLPFFIAETQRILQNSFILGGLLTQTHAVKNSVRAFVREHKQRLDLADLFLKTQRVFS